MDESMIRPSVFKQSQPKTKGKVRWNSRVEKVWDIIKKGEHGDVYCLVKYNRINRTGWISYEKLKETEPQKVIDYFESRIQWPNITLNDNYQF